MSAAKHTPTPWRFDSVKRGTLNIGTGAQSEMRAAGYAITAIEPAMFGGTRVLDDERLREADAAFIVRACNAHAALVAALTRAADHLVMTGTKSDDAPEALAQARAALALVKP